LQSLEQVIGVQPATATSAAAATTATAGTATTTAASTAAGGTTSAKSATAALQTYINNVSQKLQANGAQTANLAKSNLNVSA